MTEPTNTPLSDQDLIIQQARKRVEDIKGFYVHVGVYVIVNAALITINLLTNPDHLWFFWPLIGWGIGLAIHGFTLLTEGRLLGPEWEEREMQKILERRSKDLHLSP